MKAILIVLAVLLLGCDEDIQKQYEDFSERNSVSNVEPGPQEVVVPTETSDPPGDIDTQQATEGQDNEDSCRSVETAEGTLKIYDDKTTFTWLVGETLDVERIDPCAGYSEFGDDEVVLKMEDKYYRVFMGQSGQLHLGQVMAMVQHRSHDDMMNDPASVCLYVLRPEPFNDIQNNIQF